MAKGGIDGVALGAVAAGSLFAYAGIKGNSILASLQTIVQGKNPATASNVHPIIATDPALSLASEAGTGFSGDLGGRIAADAAQYKGAGYQFGGAPDVIGRWDCSSFVNRVIGMDLHLAIPTYRAGSYTGKDHGPTAAMWLVWTGATTVSRNPSDAIPGDLCCWQTHIGIALGGGQMISARSAHSHPPTGIGSIAHGGPRGELLFIRRLKAAGRPVGPTGGPTAS